MAKKRVPETRYPHNLEKAYAKRIIKMVDALGDVALTEFDKQPELFNDASISEQIKSMVNKIKGLSLGIFNEKDVAKVASSHVRAVSSSSKSNVNSQIAVSGVNPIETEPWIKDYTDVKIVENVSYITNIRDEYTQKIEQTIYRGVTEGKSNAEIKKELVEQTGMAENKAKFIARDQTGTLLGQMNAERHMKAGIEAFIWKDSDDGAVRDTHAERDGHLYYYDDGPLLPGTEYGCRCIAKPAFEEDIEEAEENGTAVHEEGNKQENTGHKKNPSLPKSATIKEKIEQIKNNATDVTDEAVIKEAGKIIKVEFEANSSFKKRTDDLNNGQKEYEDLRKKEMDTERTNLTEMKERYRETASDLEEQFYENEITLTEYNSGLYEANQTRMKEIREYKEKNPLKSPELINKINDLRSNLYYDNAEDVKKIFNKIRPMGSAEFDIKAHLSGSRTATAKTLAKAYDYYPTEWIKSSVDYNLLKVKKVKRGYYRHENDKDGYAELTLSGEGHSSFKTAIHELGHRMERAVNGIIGVEKKFYDRRTKGELLKWMGRPYGKGEKSRKDDFLNIYMGKDYNEQAYELISMGLEKLYTNPVELMEDEDMFTWICGILALI